NHEAIFSNAFPPQSLQEEFLDQLIVPGHYVPTFTYYTPPLRDATKAPNCISGQKILKDTLSETLTRFYPLAGRVQNEDEHVINCNDKGIVFSMARVNNCTIADFLSSSEPKIELLYQFLPTLPPVTKIRVDDSRKLEPEVQIVTKRIVFKATAVEGLRAIAAGEHNMIFLLDGAKEGDIDAWVALDQREMDVLEENLEFLAFASLNPPIMLST
ncbi:hypothetical protein RJ640_007668, partial [Escallonia rubra]